jgi:L,D-transpeptidase ErfK/SrfK
MQKFTFILITLFLLSPAVYASGAFPVNDPSMTIIGFNEIYTIKDKETLIELAREYDVGYDEIVSANNGVDPWTPKEGTEIVIPTRWILPEILDDGIVINLAEMRLYYFFSSMGNKYVKTFPIGIGTEGFDTPLGTYKITAKVKDPVWRIPSSFRDEYPHLPDFVPPGPDNPLGRYWLQLSKGYGMHGTNRPFGIGRRVSHGCIRLYPEDIKVLFSFAKRGATVKIVNEPVKIGAYNNRVYVEIHRSGKEDEELLRIAKEKLSRKPLKDKINMRSLMQEIKNASGLPTVISN